MKIHVFAKSDEAEFTSISAAVEAAADGDVVVVHEGVYRETLTIEKSNVAIEAAEGEYVLVSGNDCVANGNYDATAVNEVDVADAYDEAKLAYTQVFINGKYQTMARFPKLKIADRMAPTVAGGGFSKLSNIYKDESAGHVTFEELPAVNLSGAIFRGIIGKNRHYTFGKVIEATGNAIAFEGLTKNDWGSSRAIAADFHEYGFGFVTHKNLVEEPGEWFVEDRKLYFKPVTNETKIEMQVRTHVLKIANAEKVSLKGLNFVSGAAEMENVESLNIENCSFRYLHGFYVIAGYGIGDSLKTGIYMKNMSNLTFVNSYVAHSWGHGVHIDGGENVTFRNNVIEDIGWIGSFTSGLYTSADNTHIEDCSFRDNGRFQIRVDKDIKINVLHSSFERAMKMGEDAGPLEFTSTGQVGPLDLKGSEIAYNKICDLHGIPVSGGHYNKQFVVAFYMEDTHNYTAHHNLIYDIVANTYDGPEEIMRRGTLLYLGPRVKAMHKKVHFYNNTAWDYTNNINIWNIFIANYDELKSQGLEYAEQTGTITKGHFANNLFNAGGFGINYSSQTFDAEGKKLGWAKVPANEGKSIDTTDMEKYFEHAAKVGYHFNPEANMILDKDTGAANYADASNGDFRLATTSKAVGAGVAIAGITSSAKPDLGALEGGDRVLSAGATLEIPVFKEELE